MRYRGERRNGWGAMHAFQARADPERFLDLAEAGCWDASRSRARQQGSAALDAPLPMIAVEQGRISDRQYPEPRDG